MFSHITRLEAPTDIELERMMRVGRAWREIRRGSAARALRIRAFGNEEDALDPGQVDTLDLLATKECWRMGDLAEALHIDPSTATRAVQRLLTTGLATKVSQEGDARVVHVALTELGRETAVYYRQRRLDVIRSLISNFTPEEQDEFIKYLERFVNNMAEIAQEADAINAS